MTSIILSRSWKLYDFTSCGSADWDVWAACWISFFKKKKEIWGFFPHWSDVCVQIWTQKQQRVHKHLNICSSILPTSAEELCQKDPPPSPGSDSDADKKPLKLNRLNNLNTVGVRGSFRSNRRSTFIHEEWPNAISLPEQTTHFPKCKHNRKPNVSHSGFFALLSVCPAFVTEKTMRAHKHRRLFLTDESHWETCGVLVCLRADARLSWTYLPGGACLLTVS